MRIVDLLSPPFSSLNALETRGKRENRLFYSKHGIGIAPISSITLGPVPPTLISPSGSRSRPGRTRPQQVLAIIDAAVERTRKVPRGFSLWKLDGSSKEGRHSSVTARERENERDIEREKQREENWKGERWTRGGGTEGEQSASRERGEDTVGR